MAKHMPKRNLERVGQGVTGACVALVTLLVLALIVMVAQKGISTFVKDGVDVVGFFTGTDSMWWSPPVKPCLGRRRAWVSCPVPSCSPS